MEESQIFPNKIGDFFEKNRRFFENKSEIFINFATIKIYGYD